ncbi:MAG TPA: metallophosphoesterase [Longimicrobiaceae bacterium]|nr:metallophosphoesterase [Longimicrobiaceae bacterium]
MRRRASSALRALLLLALAGCAQRAYAPLEAAPIKPELVAVDLFLIGDAGRPAPGGEPVLKALRVQLKEHPDRAFVVFLGDNIYPEGMPDSTASTRDAAEWKIEQQMEVLKDAGVHGVFVPGNHDWAPGTRDGWRAVVREGRFVVENGGDLVDFQPRYGCPGPVVRDLGDVVRLVMLDTQWWLQEESPKPQGKDSGCAFGTADEVTKGVEAALAGAGQRVTVVVGHHPTVSGGEHGGYFSWWNYLFPPYTWARKHGFFAPQDVGSTDYGKLRESLLRAFSDNPPDLYAAGHEHNLQVLRGAEARYVVVSGGGIYAHWTPVSVIAPTLYARQASGYVRLTVRGDGWARLSVQAVDASGTPHEDYSFWIRPDTVTQ